MISPAYLVNILKDNGIEFYTGVPDSLLKGICAYITDKIEAEAHVIAANEGGAVGLAAGYHLATGKIPLVYMQNSGMGNAVNPLLSLMDPDVYNMPLLLLIGWRGEPGHKDEPQHVKQGKLTLPLLDTLGIPYEILADNDGEVSEQITQSLHYIRKQNGIFALVVRKGIVEDYAKQDDSSHIYDLSREEAIQTITSLLDEDSIVVSSTGMISRELYEYRESVNENHIRDFLTVGSMGHASQIALGIAMQRRDLKIYCFDGDGALLMHMGALPIIAAQRPENFVHIVFNNGAHDSVGGQPTVGFDINIPEIAQASGYKKGFSVSSAEEIRTLFPQMMNQIGPLLLEVKVKRGNRKDLGRPSTTPIQNKTSLMEYIEKK